MSQRTKVANFLPVGEKCTGQGGRWFEGQREEPEQSKAEGALKQQRKYGSCCLTGLELERVQDPEPPVILGPKVLF